MLKKIGFTDKLIIMVTKKGLYQIHAELLSNPLLILFVFVNIVIINITYFYSRKKHSENIQFFLRHISNGLPSKIKKGVVSWTF